MSRNSSYQSEVTIGGKQVLVLIDEDNRSLPSSVEIIASSPDEPHLALESKTPMKTNPSTRAPMDESLLHVMLNWRGFRSSVNGGVVGNLNIVHARSPHSYTADFVLMEYYGLRSTIDEPSSEGSLVKSSSLAEGILKSLNLRFFREGEVVNVFALRGYQNGLFR